VRNINKVLVALTIGGAAFGTIGSGAGADFIDHPAAHQQINSGTLLVSLSGDGQSSDATAVTPAAITLNPIGPTNSSFSSYKTITATNKGTVTGTMSDIELGTTGDVDPLANDVHISVAREDGTYVCSGSVAHCTGVNLTPGGSYVLAPGASLVMHISTYAGGNSGAPALTNVDEGKILNETLSYTVNG
jgi:hypothetical protein